MIKKQEGNIWFRIGNKHIVVNVVKKKNNHRKHFQLHRLTEAINVLSTNVAKLHLALLTKKTKIHFAQQAVVAGCASLEKTMIFAFSFFFCLSMLRKLRQANCFFLNNSLTKDFDQARTWKQTFSFQQKTDKTTLFSTAVGSNPGPTSWLVPTRYDEFRASNDTKLLPWL